jgi:alkanesulfonate monooxygenase SsuD/methylene tetrahydromethanopterin reductase-like flavin-dependent oxidoreductase (luciferase family)
MLSSCSTAYSQFMGGVNFILAQLYVGVYTVELLRERLPIGTPAQCAEKLVKLQAAGVCKVFLWPVEDEVGQLARFHEQVLPRLPP